MPQTRTGKEEKIKAEENREGGNSKKKIGRMVKKKNKHHRARVISMLQLWSKLRVTVRLLYVCHGIPTPSMPCILEIDMANSFSVRIQQ